ncbi:MAG: VCBS repeat-containing protein [Planctomycetota bacterium]
MQHGLTRMIAAAAGLSMAGTALAQFGGFGELLAQRVSIREIVRDLEGGDVDGDGLPDIVFIDNTARVSFFSGFSDGVFDGPRREIVEPDAAGRAIELADYDRDGDLDLLRVADVNTGDFRAYRNDGSGNFEFDFAVTGFGSVPAFSSLSFGDFEGDGDEDLYALISDGIVVFENTGSTFSRTPIVQQLPAFTGLRLATGDIDGDGRDDAVATSSSNDSVYVLRSEGTRFTETDRFSPGLSLIDIKLVDIDLDGALDIITTNTGGDPDRVSVYRNDGSGDFDFDYALSLENPFEVEVADIDSDGDQDVIVAREAGFDPQRIVVYLNDGSGAFDLQAEEWDVCDGDIDFFELIDVDGSGGPDLVSAVGFFSQCFTVRFNQTPFSAPGGFALVSPPDGAAGLAPPAQVSAWGGEVRPQFQWERATGFDVRYDVLVALSPDLGDPVFEAVGIDGRFADAGGAALQPGTTYFWGVTARNAAGETLAGPFTFTTAASGSDCPADFDGDGELTLFDFLAFSNAFDAGCP